MKKKIVTVLLAALLAAMMTACGDTGTGGNTGTDSDRNSDEVTTQEQDVTGMVHLENAEDVSAFFEEIYAGVPAGKLPSALETIEMDMEDRDTIIYNTGLTDINGISGITLSESMMGSIAYSMFYIRTTDDADPEDIRQRIMDNIDPAKWICVSAEKQAAGIFGQDIFYVMGSEETVDLVYEQAVKAAQNRGLAVSDVLEQTNPQ